MLWPVMALESSEAIITTGRAFSSGSAILFRDLAGLSILHISSSAIPRLLARALIFSSNSLVRVAPGLMAFSTPDPPPVTIATLYLW